MLLVGGLQAAKVVVHHRQPALAAGNDAVVGVGAVFGGGEEADRPLAEGVGDELRHRRRQLRAEDLAVDPAEALHGRVRKLVVEQDRRLAQHVAVPERREPEHRAVDVKLEIGADRAGRGQRAIQPGCRQMILQQPRRTHRAGRQYDSRAGVARAVGADHAGDRRRVAGRVGQRHHVLAAQQREVRRLADRIDQVPFGVGLVAATPRRSRRSAWLPPGHPGSRASGRAAAAPPASAALAVVMRSSRPCNSGSLSKRLTCSSRSASSYYGASSS